MTDSDSTNKTRIGFETGLNAFYSGTVHTEHTALDAGATSETIKTRNQETLRELDALVSEFVLPSISDVEFASAQDEATQYEIIYDPVALTPFDKARQALTAAESRLAKEVEGSALYAAANKALEDAHADFEKEKERAVDPAWRKLRAIDTHRAGGGREERNEQRRMVRKKPNADLKNMTPEQKKAHRAAQVKDNVFIKRKRDAGWTNEQIESGLHKLRAKRNSKANGR